ncbi:hypothetical protein HDU76_006792 [Blyttiomyces sp. JEL0837]|nr:hypothetical protein HDU76_006792 [Blyttiomyces sp. JEL0837]
MRRAIHTTILYITDKSRSGGPGPIGFAAREFTHDLPWIVLYSGGITYVFALIHATPKRIAQLDTARPNVYLPSITGLNMTYFGESLIEIN